MAVVITDLNQNMNTILVEGKKKITWTKQNKVIAIHNGSKLYVFLLHRDEF